MPASIGTAWPLSARTVWLSGALALLAGPVAAEPSGPVISETRHYYSLDATGLDALRKQLADAAIEAGLPAGTIGRTRQSMETRYRLDPVPGGCRLNDLEVSLGLRLDLPAWRPSGTTRRELRDKWARMLAALTRHEEGHRDNAVWAAREIHSRLSGLAQGSDCDALGKLAQREMFRVKLRFNLREQAYDRRTGHGVGQGAVL